MKKNYLTLLLVIISLSCIFSEEKNLEKRIKPYLYGNFNINQTSIIKNFIDVGVGAIINNNFFSFSTELGFFVGDNNILNSVNKDFDIAEAKHQNFLGISYSIGVLKELDLIKNKLDFLYGIKLKGLMSNGQSISFNDKIHNQINENYIMGNNYGTAIISPEIEFYFYERVGLKISYNYSLNEVKPFENIDNKYRFSYLSIGLRANLD